ncbi:hypothetical protein H6G54_08990 [Anabaena cylindrica FACHB-243]|uniref:Uncharacterized protein n=1 Tax=Anabaena cylindrica (strain ATCC 27899 / PCC 7122) TaxID=272123 RepID=K9ZMT9_ANACC|nr:MULTISPECIES: hypothetical protein [Anabaena]AFZ60104.1 hypothetical protein Anacy_4759 [Anabaena cylindrica PCC 7122]MBD2417840.1 hypothetical protein [Anabaena cylindrica FACHB-243]MBY5283739.1 hypothetical protein [Anabaena sp. CCAP 1446/1C]MBY5307967.1 hypothetical protein [Anabaena sp. CCAP 1446/1C]MCM2404755.1 hypothetical protein [Anabaena sp. CCAP 1446/1C]
MLPKIKRIYRIEEFSRQDILYHSFTPGLGIISSIFGGWTILCFYLLVGAFISILFLDIDNCYEVLTCNFNSALGRISLKQRNIFSQGVIELSLAEIETVIINSRSSSFSTKTRFGKKIQIDNQLYWITFILYSGEHHRLTYYETTLLSNKQKMVDYILFLKANT